MSFMDQFAIPSGGASSGGSGKSVGTAQGKITVDTASLSQGRAVVIREAKLMGDAMRGLGPATREGVREAENELNRFQQTVATTKRGISLMFAAVTAGGVAASMRVKQVTMLFKVLAGSEQKSNQLMGELRDLAERTNQPFIDLLQSANGLMPALRGSNASLSQTILLAQRLAIMDPAQGVTGASFAIREFLNGEYLSLVKRLELDRGTLKQILADANGDAGLAIQGLSAYIDKIGVSEEQLISMGKEGGNAFAVLKDEVAQTLATTFTPFLNDVLIPIVRTFSDLVKELRKVNPEILKFAGIAMGLASLQAAGTTGLPFIGRIPGGGAMAGAGTLAAAAYAGVQGGAYLGRQGANAGVGGLEEYKGKSQSETLGMVKTTFKQLIVLVYNGAVAWAKVLKIGSDLMGNVFGVLKATFNYGTATVGNALADLSDTITDVVSSIARGIGNFLKGIDELDLGIKTVHLGTAGAGNDLLAWADILDNTSNGLRTSTETMQGYWNVMAQGVGLTEEQTEENERLFASWGENVIDLARSLDLLNEKSNGTIGVLNNMREAVMAGLGAVAQQVMKVNHFTDDQLNLWGEYQADITEIDADAQEERTEQEADYQQSITDINAKYKDKEREDHQKYLDDIAEVQEKAQERRVEAEQRRDDQIASAGEDLTERTAELQEKHNQDELYRLEDHQRKMLNMERDHRYNLLNAAANLDARAVWQEQRKYEIQKDQAQEEFDIQTERKAEQLQREIDQEQDAHDKKIAQARVAYQRTIDEGRIADDKRLADLRIAYQREQLENANQKALELAKLRTDNAMKMAEIDNQAAKEKAAREKAFIEQWNQLAQWEGQKIGLQRNYQQQWTQELTGYLNAQNTVYQQMGIGLANMITGAWNSILGLFGGGSGGGNLLSNLWGAVTSHDIGGRVMSSGPAMLSKGEEIIKPDVARTMRRAAGGEITSSMLVAGGAGGGTGGRGGVQWLGDVNNYWPADVGQWTREEISDFARQSLMETLDMLAG